MAWTRTHVSGSFGLVAVLVASLATHATEVAKALAIEPGFMDLKTSPCVDFYRYANGAWLDTVRVPAEYSSIGSFREVSVHNQEVLRKVLEQAALGAGVERDPTIKRLGYFYASLMDSARADRERSLIVTRRLERIRSIRGRTDLSRELGRLTQEGVGLPLQLRPEPDPERSTIYMAQLIQGDLGLPDREFYFRTDPGSKAIRQGYVTYLEQLLALAGVSGVKARTDADAVLSLETALAESALTRVQMRDPRALVHPMSTRELRKLAPQVNWREYFNGAGVTSLAGPVASMNVASVSFTRRFAVLLGEVPVDTWRAYLSLLVLRQAAPWLSADFHRAQFAWDSLNSGAKACPPRWRRALVDVDRLMGEALGMAYVRTAFNHSAKERILAIVENIHSVMKERIRRAAWMEANTKKQAQEKLDAILQKIGYPSTWRDYSKLEIGRSAPAGESVANAESFEARRQLAKIGQPVVREEWQMPPQAVNAYYNPRVNEIVFPAGILQAPFFDPSAEDAVNYGAIGMIIGHEITHAFDDEGRQFDSVGNLRSWWTPRDDARFRDKAKNIIDQYSRYVGVDTLHIDGELTLGENIADIGGLSIAYDAWELSRRGTPSVRGPDGFTPDQRFFISFAQAWRNKTRSETLRTELVTSSHAPAKWRVNGTVSDLPQFQRAFGCSSSYPLNRGGESQTGIW